MAEGRKRVLLIATSILAVRKLAQFEGGNKVRDAIQRLPSQYRIVLVLRDMKGLAYEEVAEITGLRSGSRRRLISENLPAMCPASRKAVRLRKATAEELQTGPRGDQTEVVAILTATRFLGRFSL